MVSVIAGSRPRAGPLRRPQAPRGREGWQGRSHGTLGSHRLLLGLHPQLWGSDSQSARLTAVQPRAHRTQDTPLPLLVTSSLRLSGWTLSSDSAAGRSQEARPAQPLSPQGQVCSTTTCRLRSGEGGAGAGQVSPWGPYGASPFSNHGQVSVPSPNPHPHSPSTSLGEATAQAPAGTTVLSWRNCDKGPRGTEHADTMCDGRAAPHPDHRRSTAVQTRGYRAEGSPHGVRSPSVP